MVEYVRGPIESSDGKQPEVPIIGIAQSGIRSASVSFSFPNYLGKRDEDNVDNTVIYVATANPGGITASSQSSPITVTGLTPGVSYTFTVVATNGVATSIPSGSTNSVVPQAPPPYFTLPPYFPPPPHFTVPPHFTLPPHFTRPPHFTLPPHFTRPPYFSTPPRFPPNFPPYFLTPPRFPPRFTPFFPPPRFTPYFAPPPPRFTPFFPPPRFPPFFPPPRFPPRFPPSFPPRFPPRFPPSFRR